MTSKVGYSEHYIHLSSIGIAANTFLYTAQTSLQINRQCDLIHNICYTCTPMYMYVCVASPSYQLSIVYLLLTRSTSALNFLPTYTYILYFTYTVSELMSSATVVVSVILVQLLSKSNNVCSTHGNKRIFDTLKQRSH